VRQPLHATARFTREHAEGDQGGNLVAVECGQGCASAKNLRAFWDGVMRANNSAEFAAEASARLPKADALKAAIDDEATWIAESVALAQNVVYRDILATLSSVKLQSRPSRSWIEGYVDYEGGQEDVAHQAQKHLQPGEDASEVVADGGEDGVCGVAGGALEVAAVEMAFGLHVTDHGLDGGAAAQFTFDDTEDAALLARDEYAARVRRIVATISLVDIDALDLAAGEALGVLDDGPQCTSVIGIAR